VLGGPDDVAHVTADHLLGQAEREAPLTVAAGVREGRENALGSTTMSTTTGPSGYGSWQSQVTIR